MFSFNRCNDSNHFNFILARRCFAGTDLCCTLSTPQLARSLALGKVARKVFRGGFYRRRARAQRRPRSDFRHSHTAWNRYKHAVAIQALSSPITLRHQRPFLLLQVFAFYLWWVVCCYYVELKQGYGTNCSSVHSRQVSVEETEA